MRFLGLYRERRSLRHFSLRLAHLRADRARPTSRRFLGWARQHSGDWCFRLCRSLRRRRCAHPAVVQGASACPCRRWHPSSRQPRLPRRPFRFSAPFHASHPAPVFAKAGSSKLDLVESLSTGRGGEQAMFEKLKHA